MTLRCYIEITNSARRRQARDTVERVPDRFVTLDAFAMLLSSLRARRTELVRLGGGEPLAHPNFVDLVRMVRDAGLLLQVETTGRSSGPEPAAATLLKSAPMLVAVVLFAADRAIHDRLCEAPGAYDETIETLHSLLSPPEGPPIEILIPVSQDNHASVCDIISTFARYDRARFRFRVIGSDGPLLAGNNQSAWIRAFGNTLASCIDRAPGIQARIAVDGTAFCFWDRHQSYFVVDSAWKTPWDLFELDAGIIATIEPDLVKPVRACSYCSFDEVCPGVARAQASQFDEAFRPPMSPIPNFMRFTKVSGDEYDSRARAEPDRYARIVASTGTTFVRLASAYYTGRNLRRAKRLGLLYYNISDQFPVTDFSAQLRQLTRSSDMPGEGPTETFTVSESPPFSDEGPFAIDQIREIRGRVLDVGFGAFHYGQRMDALHAAGQISYVGLDPSRAAWAVAKRRFPRLPLFAQSFESASLSPGTFDWVLLLGSMNHLADLRACMARVRALLAPGGCVLASDNTSFGLLGNVPVRGELGGGWEHYRNLDSAGARDAFLDAGYSIVSERPVVAGGRNQWFIIARNADPRGP